ncbi:MAG: LysR family transcriptional regulator [Chloroflexaceae bacterium]|nr:LysR family transcriptional regulator [Chloroflexaceae bacterium]
MIDPYKLRIFMRVADVGSFSQAANTLYMSQAGVSQHIQELEASLGTRLFERGRRGVTLTDAGRTLHEYSTQILHLLAEAELAVTNVANLPEGQMNVGATPGMSAYLLPDWIYRFRQQYPALSVSLHTATTGGIVHDLTHRKIDMGFIEGELDDCDDSRLEVVPLQEVEQLVIVGQKSPWWEHPAIPLAALNEHALVTRQPHSQTRIWLDQTLHQHGLNPRIAGEFDNMESIKRMVISSACYSVLPAYTVQSEIELGLLRALPISDYPLRRTLKLLWNRTVPFSPVVRAFLLQLKRDFPELAV